MTRMNSLKEMVHQVFGNTQCKVHVRHILQIEGEQPTGLSFQDRYTSSNQANMRACVCERDRERLFPLQQCRQEAKLAAQTQQTFINNKL